MGIKKLKGSNKRIGRCYLKVSGDMNIYCAAELKDSLLEYLDGFSEFHVDMSAVNEMDTAGIQLLLQVDRKAVKEERSLLLSGCNEQVSDLLKLYQLQQWLAPGLGEPGIKGAW